MNMKHTKPANKRMRRRLALCCGAVTLAVLAGCAAVQTTGSGAVGVQRTQYMAASVPAAALQQEATRQYSEKIAQARAAGALDTDAAQVKRVRTIMQRLVAQVGVFRSDAVAWPWEVHVIKSADVNAWCMPG